MARQDPARDPAGKFAPDARTAADMSDVDVAAPRTHDEIMAAYYREQGERLRREQARAAEQRSWTEFTPELAAERFDPAFVADESTWSVASTQRDGLTVASEMTRTPGERIRVVVDFEAGTVSAFDAAAGADEMPVAEEGFDPDDPTDAEHVTRDLVGALPAPYPELTPELEGRNRAAMDSIARMLQNPDHGVGMLEDIAELAKGADRELDVYGEAGGGFSHADWESGEGDGYPISGEPGSAERDHTALNNIASALRRPQWDDPYEMLSSIQGVVGRTGRDARGDGKTITWGRH